MKEIAWDLFKELFTLSPLAATLAAILAITKAFNMLKPVFSFLKNAISIDVNSSLRS